MLAVRMDWEIIIKGNTYKEEIYNSDMTIYGGTGNVYNPSIRSELVDKNEKIYRLRVNLPALAGIILK